jgi:AraC family transcriptional regulator of adaptative response / DNA-3-methyladenine glycosylase II
MTSTREALSVRRPYLAAALLRFLDDRAIPGVEAVDGSTYRRSLATPDGPAVITVTPSAAEVAVSVDAEGPAGASFAVDRARALFDVDADPDAVARVLYRDVLLRPLVRAHPGVRVPGAADGFELVVRAILGQQVSVAAARTMLGRVAARFGTAVDGAGEDLARRFPTADRLADAPLEELGVTRRRAATVRLVASAASSGALDLTPGADPDAAGRALLELDGIGPWTVEYVRMRALGDRDAFPASDLGIRRALERLGADPRPVAVAARAEAWRPWRAYAAMLLWSASA